MHTRQAKGLDTTVTGSNPEDSPPAWSTRLEAQRHREFPTVTILLREGYGGQEMLRVFRIRSTEHEIPATRPGE
jgi:hypothetical protein